MNLVQFSKQNYDDQKKNINNTVTLIDFVTKNGKFTNWKHSTQ